MEELIYRNRQTDISLVVHIKAIKYRVERTFNRTIELFTSFLEYLCKVEGV